MAKKKNEAQIEFKAITSDFSKGIKAMNGDIKTLNSQLKLNSAELKGNGDNVDDLQKRQQLLQAKLQASTQKVELTQKSLEACKNTLGENSTEYQKLERALNTAKTEQQAIQNEISQTDNKLTQLIKTNKQASTAFGALTMDIFEQENKLAQLKAEYSNIVLEHGRETKKAESLATEIVGLTKALQENKNKLNLAKQAAEEIGEEYDRVNDVVKKTDEGFTVAKGVVSNFASEGISKAVEAFQELGVEAEQALDKMNAKIGASGEAAKKYTNVAKNVYKSGWGESLEDTSAAVAEVATQFDYLNEQDLQKITKNSMTLSDVYDFDISESLRAVKSLMNQFGISADEAYNLVVQGAQDGLNQNGDLLDTINEYSVQFSSAGYSADQMLNMLANGAAKGTWSIDKLGDAVKEYNIRMSDGTANDGLTMIGLNADEVTKKFAKGGKSAQEATQQVMQALLAVKDPQKQYIAGQTIMGTMWEDLGVDAVNALMKTTGEIDKTKDAMGQVETTAYDNLGRTLKSLGATIKTDILQPVAERLVPVTENLNDKITKISTWAKTHQKTLAAIGVVIGVIAGAIALYNVVAAVKAAMDAAQVATLGGLIAVKLADAAATMAMLAPYILIVAAIAAVIAIIVVLVKNFDKIKEKVREIVENVKEKFTEMKNKISEIFNNIKQAISEKLNAAKTVVTTIINKIKQVFTTVFNAIKKVVTTVLTVIAVIVGTYINIWLKIFTTVFNAIKKVVTTVLNAIKSVITNVMNAIKNFITPIWNDIKNVISTVINSIRTTVLNVFNKIKDSITNVINNIRTTVSNVFNKIKTAITTPINSAKSTAISVFDTIKTRISSTVNSIRTTVSNVFNKVKTAITSPIESARDKVKNIVDKIKGFFQFTMPTPKIKLPHFGIDPSGWKLNDLLEGSIPTLKITWNAKGAVFTKPTVFAQGVGEGDPEYALPLNDRSLSPLAAMINKNMAAQGYGGQSEAVLKAIYQETRESNRLFKDRMIDALVNGVDLVIDNREIARLIKRYG